MENRKLIKVAHVWALVVLLVAAVCALGGSAVIGYQNQNSNQNSNSNANTGSSSRSQNRNANKHENANTTASGERAAMGNMTTKDHEFVMDAAMGGLMEVELGRVAAQQGTSEAVKQFGQRMVDDHSKANAELMTLAQGKGMTLPTQLDEKHQKNVTKLSAMKGAEFDRAYSKMMLSDHEKDVAEFEKQSTKAADPDLKAFASKTLPTLQEHLQMARALNPGSSGNSNSNRSGGPKNSNSNRNSNSNSNRP